MSLRVADLRCSSCGSPERIAIRPGHEPQRNEVVGLVERGEPLQCWCAMCWAAPAMQTEMVL